MTGSKLTLWDLMYALQSSVHTHIHTQNLCECSADTCTILNLSGGTLAGMACGIQKSFGFPSSSVLGGQQFYLRVMPACCCICGAIKGQQLPPCMLLNGLEWMVCGHIRSKHQCR